MEGPSLKVSNHWACEGVKLWLKLTKVLDEPWCDMMATILQHVLSRTCKTAFRVQRMTSKKRQTNQQIYDMLLPLMLDEINEFIQPTHWPNHMDPFDDINFPWTPASSPGSQSEKNFRQLVATTRHLVPIHQIPMLPKNFRCH